MKIFKYLMGLIAVYIIFVVVFEAGYLGALQPSFADNGIPMLVLTTRDRSGDAQDRMLARFELEGRLYVSAHHWPRGWYHRAVERPDVRVAIDGVVTDRVAVPVEGVEFAEVASAYPLPFMVRFLMGFPPTRDILRLDAGPGGG